MCVLVFAALRVFALASTSQMSSSQKYLIAVTVMCLSLVAPVINFVSPLCTSCRLGVPDNALQWLLSKSDYLYVYYGPIAGNICLGEFSTVSSVVLFQ